jgi:hypothetical protein
MNTAFWDIRVTTLMMEAVSTPETWVCSYDTTWRSIPEGCQHRTVVSKLCISQKEQEITVLKVRKIREGRIKNIGRSTKETQNK